tara:strand:+ start:573 stop:1724 length:1152 start_codon:yes stop_codon:yes gene_type:complete
MPPKKIPQSYEKFYDKNTGTPLRPLPLPLPLNREEVSRKMELVSERRLQDSQEKSSPSKIFLEEIEKQQKSEKKNKINTRTFENILSDKEEERNKKKEEKKKESEKRLKGLQGLSALKMRQEINKEKGEEEEEEVYEENEEIRELRELRGRKKKGVSLIDEEPYKPVKSAAVQKVRAPKYRTSKEKYCDMNNCTIMGGSDDDTDYLTEYCEKIKETVINVKENKVEYFEKDLQDISNIGSLLLIQMYKPEEINITYNLTKVIGLLNSLIELMENLKEDLVDDKFKIGKITRINNIIYEIVSLIKNFKVMRQKFYEIEVPDIDLTISPYSYLNKPNVRYPYAMEDRTVIMNRNPQNDSMGGKTKKRKIKKRNKSKKNKRRASKK